VGRLFGSRWSIASLHCFASGLIMSHSSAGNLIVDVAMSSNSSGRFQGADRATNTRSVASQFQRTAKAFLPGRAVHAGDGRSRVPVMFDPLNGKYPHSMMYIMTPRDQMSQASE
jgi:hypothetical protein